MGNGNTGKLTALYGVNNLGKTTQAKLLVENLKNKGIPAIYKKYAVYDLAPSGPLLNEYLRNGNPHGLTPREFQMLQVLNRTQNESWIKNFINSGIWVITEDYVGTGIAWGAGAGVDMQFLENLNSHLLQPHHSFLFYGKRFLSSIEKNHKHENDDELIREVADFHDLIADKYHWEKIWANDSIEFIAGELIRKVL